MTNQRQEQLIAQLRATKDWLPASALADHLGVTTRSVRGYIAAINANTPDAQAIESGPLGYRLAAGDVSVSADVQAPKHRRRALARAIVAALSGVDIHEFADEQFVSSATIESDLVKVRPDVTADTLAFQRDGSRVWVEGAEKLRRRTLYRLLKDDSVAGFDLAALDAHASPGTAALVPAVRRDLSARLHARGSLINDFAMTGVAVMTLLSAHRARSGSAIGAYEVTDPELAEILADTVFAHTGIEISDDEAAYLSTIVASRGAAIDASGTAVDGTVLAAVAESVREASARYGVAGLNNEFLHRLARHVERLRTRSLHSDPTRNPLARSLKSAYPLLFDVAVFVADRLRTQLGVQVDEDEIAYLALHIGGQWERDKQRADRPTAIVVSPGYYELQGVLLSNIRQSLGSSLQVIGVQTEAGTAELTGAADLVLTTVASSSGHDRTVQISPFLTESDVERVQAAIARVRRSKRRANLRAQLRQYLLPEAFVTAIPATATEHDVITMLGQRLVSAGVIDDSYIDSTLERERASSTAFTSTLAVPHAMAMTATRTAMAIGLAESSLPWGSGRVQIVAFVAFSENDREAFQTVFDQFVDVFSEPETARRLIRAGTDAEAFVAELAAVIGS